MLTQDDERDENLDHDSDADRDEDKNSEEDEEDEHDDNEDQDDDSNDSDEDEDDDKPVTRKELREMLSKNNNNRNANRRVHSKDQKGDRNKDRNNDQRHNSQSPKTEDRLSQVEKSLRKTELLETKRAFGYENQLSPAQVDVVFRMTKRPTAKFLKEPYVKAALDAIAASSNVRDNTPSSGGRNFKSQGGKSWEKMDPNEKQQNFADRRRAILANKRG